MKRASTIVACALGLVSLTGASPAAPAIPAAGMAAAMALVQQSYGRCTGPEYGARVQQCIQTRCAPAGGSVAECAASCQAQVRAECGA